MPLFRSVILSPKSCGKKDLIESGNPDAIETNISVAVKTTEKKRERKRNGKISTATLWLEQREYWEGKVEWLKRGNEKKRESFTAKNTLQ